MSDRRTVLAVVCFLGTLVIAVAIGSFALVLNDKSIDPALVGLGGTALGGLVGLLVPTSGRQEVVVRQPADQPVPTTDVGAISVVEACLIGLFLLVVLLVLGVLPTR